MGITPAPIANLHFPEAIIDNGLFSSPVSSFFKNWGIECSKRQVLHNPYQTSHTIHKQC